MASGGKPLWFIQIATTFSIFFLTIFFVAVMSSWSSGISDVVDKPDEFLKGFPVDRQPNLIKCLEDFKSRISKSTFYFPLIVGMMVALTGSAFAYVLYKEKASETHGLIWFGSVCSFTLVWMVTSIIFYTDVSAIGRRLHVKDFDVFHAPLTSVYDWGYRSSGTTALMLVVVPTVVFLFLSFAAYRLYVKLGIFGNVNPDVVGIATETKPGSWFDRQTGAEGGTWQREEDPTLVSKNSLTDKFEGKSGSRIGYSGNPIASSRNSLVVNNDSKPPVARNADATASNGWGTWLEDVFDYTF